MQETTFNFKQNEWLNHNTANKDLLQHRLENMLTGHKLNEG